MADRSSLNLRELYGPNFRDDFSVHTRNIRTGAISARAHHCGDCQSAVAPKCYSETKLHLVFCLAPVQDGDEVGICGERFQVRSPAGCYTHPYKAGYNLIFKEYLRGKELSPEAKGLKREDPDLTPAPQVLEVRGDHDYQWYNNSKREAAFKDKPLKLRTKTGRSKMPLTQDYRSMLSKR